MKFKIKTIKAFEFIRVHSCSFVADLKSGTKASGCKPHVPKIRRLKATWHVIEALSAGCAGARA
jgi:hypothetical protein